MLTIVFPRLSTTRLPRDQHVLSTLRPNVRRIPIQLTTLLYPLNRTNTETTLGQLGYSGTLANAITALIKRDQRLLPRAQVKPFRYPPRYLQRRNPARQAIFKEASSSPLRRAQVRAGHLLKGCNLRVMRRLSTLYKTVTPSQITRFTTRTRLTHRLRTSNTYYHVGRLTIGNQSLVSTNVQPKPKLHQILRTLLRRILAKRLPGRGTTLLTTTTRITTS